MSADTGLVRRLFHTRMAAVTVVALGFSGAWAGVAQADQLGYLTNEQAGTVTQVDLSTGALGAPIDIGSQPVAIAITPDGSMAYIADYGSSQVIPFALATGTLGAPITLSDRPNAITVTPDGKTAYVVAESGRVWPITLATGHVGSATRLPANSDALAMLPSGTTAYFTNIADGTLTPFSLGSDKVGQPIDLPSATPDAVAITPDGSTAYVASNLAGTITPLDLATGVSGTAISLGTGTQPTSIAISADGSTAYVTDFGTGQIMPVALPSGTLGTPIPVAAQPSAIALVPASGITNAPPPTTGNPTSGTPAKTNGTGNTQSTLGNQQLTLKVTPGPVAAGSNAQVCYAASATVAFTLKRKTIKHAAKLKFHSVTFSLAKRSKRSSRLPATVRFPLRGLSRGVHTMTVRASFTESLARAGNSKGAKRKLSVTLTKTLTQRFSVC